MKKKSNKKMAYSTGGDIAGVVQGLSPLLNLVVPGLGTGVGAVAGVAGGLMNKADQQQQINMVPTNYKNPSALGYSHGGSLPADSFQVNAGQGQLDGMDMNYKGTDISLDFGETVDAVKNRVMSNRITNPRSGRTFADDDKKLKMNRANNEKINATNTTDPIGKFTNVMHKKMEDSLFSEQELIKALEESRSAQKSMSSQMSNKYASGGPINKAYSNDYESPYGAPSVPAGIPFMTLNQSPQQAFDSGYPMGQIGTPNNAELWDRSSYADAQAFDSQRGSLVPALAKNYNPDTLQFKSNNITPLSTLMQKPTATSTQKGPGFFDQFTLGEKVAAASGLASLGLKAAEVFQPLKKQNPYLNMGPISKMQLDPTQALYNQQQAYSSALSDSNNQTSSFAQRQAMAQGLFGNRLDAQNQIMTSYAGKNAEMAQQYEERLGQRNRENNQALATAEQINEANRAQRQNMRMGLYGDVATMGLNMADMFNAKQTEKVTLATLKKLSPDVYENYMKEIDLKGKNKKKDDGN